jgi:branched-chain amino acid transport system permease protein
MEIFSQLILNGIIAGSIYSLVALGFNLIYGTAKFFDLGYGALTAIGGYTVFYFSKILGLDIYLSIIIGVIIAGLIGFIIEKLVYKKLRNKKASNMVFMIASLGVMTTLQAIVAILFSSQFQTFSDKIESKTFEIFSGVVTNIQATMFIISIVIMLTLAFIFKFTKFGKVIKAVSDDEEVSKIVGIDTNKIIGKVFFIGSAIAGLAGILVGFDTGIEPTMGFSLLLKGVIASIIGGVGNIYGGVLGAFFLGLVENFGIWQISGEWKDAIAFTILIIFLLFRPHGFLGKK